MTAADLILLGRRRMAPALLPARLEAGRYRTDAGWFIPRFYSCFEAPWLVMRGRTDELCRRLDRAQAARCNGIRTFGMLAWPHIAYAPTDAGYWEAQAVVVQEAAARGLYDCLCFFCDAQVVVPHPADRRILTADAAAFCREHPTTWFQCANEARKNGWTEADDPALLELALQFKWASAATIVSVSDPLDTDTEEPDNEYLRRQDRIAAAADELVLHASRDEDTTGQRMARWVDHLKGLADRRSRWAGKGVRHDEPMGAASTRQPGRRDNSAVAHVAGAVVGAMCGGYTYMHRPDEDDACPGLLESAVAADIPGSPDMRFINATLPGSLVEAFSGWEKCRTLVGQSEAWAVAYGRHPGSVDFAQGWAPEVVLELQDDEGQVRVWRARR